MERIHGMPWRVFREESTIGGKDNRLGAVFTLLAMVSQISKD
jgi:hypothetical protein